MEESLNLNTLASSLPTANLQNAEKDLLNSFKAAALSITTLYRSSRHTSKRAYNAGYAAACQDLLVMIQQGVSEGGIGSSAGAHDSDGSGITIGRVMDWIEARLDAIRSREEEEEEDEEKEKERDTRRAPDHAVVVPKPDVKVTSNPTPRRAATMLATPNTPRSHPTTTTATTATIVHPSSSQPSSPSPPPPTTLRPLLHLQSPLRHSKSRSALTIKEPIPIPFPTDPHGTPGTPTPLPDHHFSNAGAKRRHAVMMLDSSPSVGAAPSASPSTSNGGTGVGGSRRRTRSARGSHQSQNQNQNQLQPHNPSALVDAMDVEEEGGRERKRVARR